MNQDNNYEGTEKPEMSLTRKLTALADGLNVYSELTGLLHTPPPTTVHLLQLFHCQLLSLLLAVLFILFHNLNALPGLGF